MPILLFSITALVISAVFHEYAHGWVANRLGDPTAKHMGRLTLNPLAHLDLFGSIILPIMLILSHSPFFIAWAKPVPYNPYNLSDQKYGGLKVALGGPMTNFLLAIFFGLLARSLNLASNIKGSLVSAYFNGNYDQLLYLMQGSLVNSIFVMSIIICFVNLILAIFNLIPVPPLDGSKIITPLLPSRWQEIMWRLEPYGLFIVLFLLAFGFFGIIWPITMFLFFLLVGM